MNSCRTNFPPNPGEKLAQVGQVAFPLELLWENLWFCATTICKREDYFETTVWILGLKQKTVRRSVKCKYFLILHTSRVNLSTKNPCIILLWWFSFCACVRLAHEFDGARSGCTAANFAYGITSSAAVNLSIQVSRAFAQAHLSSMLIEHLKVF